MALSSVVRRSGVHSNFSANCDVVAGDCAVPTECPASAIAVESPAVKIIAFGSVAAAGELLHVGVVLGGAPSVSVTRGGAT